MPEWWSTTYVAQLVGLSQARARLNASMQSNPWMASNIAIKGSGIADIAGPAARPPQVQTRMKCFLQHAGRRDACLPPFQPAQEVSGLLASSIQDHSAGADEVPVAAVLDSQGIGRRLPPAGQVSKAQSADQPCY